MSRILWWVVGIPVGVVLVALAVANRHPVLVSLDPFRPEAPALAFEAPLFIAFFATLMVGVVLGGAAVWMSQGRYRRTLRRQRAELDRLRYDRDQLARDAKLGRSAALPASNALALVAPASRRAA